MKTKEGGVMENPEKIEIEGLKTIVILNDLEQ